MKNIFKIYKNLQNDFNEPPTTYNIMAYIFYDILSSTGEFGNCCMQYAEAIREKALYIKSFPDMHFSKELCTCVRQFGDLFYNSSSNNQKILLDYIDNDKRIKLMQLEMFEIISRWISECLDDEQIIECLGKDVEYQLNSPLAPFKEFADSYELYQKHPHERSGGNGKHKED